MKLPNYFSYKLQKQTQRGYKSFTRAGRPRSTVRRSRCFIPSGSPSLIKDNNCSVLYCIFARQKYKKRLTPYSESAFPNYIILQNSTTSAEEGATFTGAALKSTVSPVSTFCPAPKSAAISA